MAVDGQPAPLDPNQVRSMSSAPRESVADRSRTLKAALALIRHLEHHQDAKKVDKPSLLDDEDNKQSKLDVPLWLLFTAKKHVATSHSL